VEKKLARLRKDGDPADLQPGSLVTRRRAIQLFAMLAAATHAQALTSIASSPGSESGDSTAPQFPGSMLDYHGYVLHDFVVDGCNVHVVSPHEPLRGRPWIWRTMFWDAFPTADLALLKAGFHLAFIDVGDTFGCPDAMKHFDAFYSVMRDQYDLAPKPALEGLSRGGLYAYRWAYVNTDKVGCIYGDAPVCDMKSWPGGRGKGKGSLHEWQEAIKDYHFSSEQEMIDFKGNPIDVLEPIAAAHIPIIHVCGDSDTVVPADENTDIVRKRYMALGGDFVMIVKEGCDHHPHGLTDPTPVVNFIVAHCASGKPAKTAKKIAPKPGTVTRLAQGQW
jgi:pimeloyl-ACP methyl ester carboxylesterase